MSERIGLVSCAQRQSAFLGLDGSMQRDCSEETAREIDEEVKVLLDEICLCEANLDCASR
jgi:ATP-dependent Zn protease